MIPNRTKDTDIASEVAQGKFLRKRIQQSAELVSSRFMEGEGLNEVIAEVAKRENFNQLQIQRLIEETNTIAFNKRYTALKAMNDRRISFELAELPKVLEHMGTDAPPVVENPNWVSGRGGEGEMTKSASFQLHSPNAKVDKMRKELQERKQAEAMKSLEKRASSLDKEIESSIFKIANTLVESEKRFKNSNVIYNSMLSDVTFNDSFSEGIAKKASEIATYLTETNRTSPDFVLSLTVNPTEKVASSVLGGYSLLKQAETEKSFAPPKISPMQDINDYKQLINLAKDLQKKQQESLDVEKQLHAGGGLSVQ